MARTEISTSDNLRQQTIEQELWRDTLVNTYFLSKFASTDVTNFVAGTGWKGTNLSVYDGVPDSVIHVKADLGAQGGTKTQKGDILKFGLLPRLDPKTNRGVTGRQKLKGKEVAVSTYDDSLTLERYRQAVSLGGPLDWNRIGYDLPAETKNLLRTWGAELMDLLCFEALEDSPTEIFYKTSESSFSVSKTATLATAKAGLSATESLITPKFLDFLRTWAITGGGRSGGKVPLRPIMIKGTPYYVYLTHSDAVFDWGNDSTAMQAYREAAERNLGDNPALAGAAYVWRNIIIHTHEFVTTGTDGGGASVPWCYGHLLGAQALVAGFGQMPSIVEDSEDYEEDNYAAWRVTMAVKAPTFNSKRYGSISSVIARTNVSGT